MTKGTNRSCSTPTEAWSWHTGGPVLTRPLPAGQFTVFGSTDGRADRGRIRRRQPAFPRPDRRADRRGIGSIRDPDSCSIPSADNNLYGVDLLTAKVVWTFPSGAPIEQEPMVADQDIYTINTAGNMSLLDPENGEPRWTRPTQGGRLAAVSETKLYLRSYNLDLFVMDRKTGRTLVDPGETHIRAGLNLREYDLDIVNRFNDRLYFATVVGNDRLPSRDGAATASSAQGPESPALRLRPAGRAQADASRSLRPRSPVPSRRTSRRPRRCRAAGRQGSKPKRQRRRPMQGEKEPADAPK